MLFRSGLGDAERAVELLISNDKKEAKELASILESENYARRKIDVDTFDAAMELVEDTLDFENDRAIILHQEEWHPGVIGIVASRLVEKYYRPTIMLTTIDGVAKGSARSVSNFDIYEALQQCEDYLIQFGGHRAAAGLAIELEKLSDFKDKFNEIVRSTINEDELLPEILIDSPLRFSEITPKLLRILDQFSPFGPGNMRPVFLSENVKLYNTPRRVGNNQNHLLCSFKQEGCDKIFDCIGFNMGDYYDILINSNGDLTIVYSIDKTIRDDKSFPQFRLKDIKTKEKLKEIV